MNVRTFAAIGITALAVGCATAPQPGAGRYGGAASRVAPKHVVVVGWDGFAGNTVEAADAPTLKRLMKEGSWTIHSRSILPSSSACNWHTIFTCSATEQHGFLKWNSREPAFPPAAVAENGLYPDLVHLLRQQRPSAKIGYIYDWDGMGFVADTNACDYAAHMAQSDITASAIAYIKGEKPDFFFVYYDSPDDKGHAAGWGSPEYMTRVTALDADLQRILNAIDEAGMTEDTVVMVTSDHGGLNKGHGGPTLSEMERPVVLWGKNVKRGHELAFPGANYDTGATIAALLGLEPPTCWIGRPFDEAFEAK